MKKLFCLIFFVASIANAEICYYSTKVSCKSLDYNTDSTKTEMFSTYYYDNSAIRNSSVDCTSTTGVAIEIAKLLNKFDAGEDRCLNGRIWTSEVSPFLAADFESANERTFELLNDCLKADYTAWCGWIGDEEGSSHDITSEMVKRYSQK